MKANLQKAGLWRANLQKAALVQVNLKKAKLRKANLQKADLRGAKLQEADLSGANLQKANLWRANLQKADLSGAKLQEAYLRGANLQNGRLSQSGLSGARLIDADLTNADLNRANLQKVDFTGAKGLSEANLKYADIRESTGLLGSEFAAKDITGSKLPEDLHKFQTLEVVVETSKNARKIFFAMLLGCVYSWLTIATTTDVRLLTNSASSPLPIIGTEIPIAWFYWAAPFVLLGLYLYFHFYLDNLWKGLASLPAIFPDGKPLDQRAYPWLLNCIVRRHFVLLTKRPILAYMKELVTMFLAWWAVPLTFIGFWLRYLPRHDWPGTWLHIGLLVITIFLAIIFYSMCVHILRGQVRKPILWKILWRDNRFYYSLIPIAVGLMLFVISHGAINGIRPQTWREINFFKITHAVPWTFQKVGFSLFVNFREMDVSIKPNDYYKIEDLKERIESVKGANLKNRNLSFADMNDAFLIKADLRNANLQQAELNRAKLQGANLERADLQEANLSHADLSNCYGLTQKQLDSACGNENSKLPSGLTIKKCSEKTEKN